MKPRQVVGAFLVVAFLSFLYWPTFRWLVDSWLSSPYYSHGFVVPFVSGFLIWTRRNELHVSQSSIMGAAVLALGAFAYVLGFIWGMPFLAGLSLLVVLCGLSLVFWGTKVTRVIFLPICFLVFMIPFPFVQDLGFHLQGVSLHSSSWILRGLGLPITTSGADIHLGDNIFTIGITCSGINTLVALVALAAVYAYLLRGQTYKRVAIFLVAFPIAVLANIMRIVSIILVANYRGVEIATGFYHDISSVIFFIIAFLLLLLLGRVLGCRLSLSDKRD